MNDWKPKMQKTVRHLAEQLTGIRSGTLSIGFIETFRASLQGNSVAIGRMASVTTQGDRIVIMPFDPANVPAVVRALLELRPAWAHGADSVLTYEVSDAGRLPCRRLP